MNERRMPFFDHLAELRRRLLISFAAVGGGFLVSTLFSRTVLEILLHPVLKVVPDGREYLIFTGPAESFLTYLKVSLISGVFLASPVVFYELWAFISPGLTRAERRFVLVAFPFSTLLFAGGAFFGYFVVFPAAFRFLLSYSTDFIKPLLSLKEYIKFSAILLLGFGIAFELPLFILLLVKGGLVEPDSLRKRRVVVVIIIFAAAAILTPPDVFSQVSMAIPLILLYEMSILLSRLLRRKGGDENRGKGPAG